MFQYNLRTLLLVMLAASMLAWTCFVLPDPIGLVVLLGLLLIVPGVTVAGIIYSRGYRRAFFIAAAPSQLFLSMVYPYLMLGNIHGNGWSGNLILEKAFALGAMSVIVISGIAGVLVRRWSGPTADPAASANQPFSDNRGDWLS